MRILVGTLYAGENEFAACQAALQGQVRADWEHFVLSHLPNKGAHDALYRTFMDRSGEFDLFLKVDADMVITRPDLLADIAARFRSRPKLGLLSVAVHDFYTDSLIFGMNAYRSGVRWEQNAEQLFVDLTPLPAESQEFDKWRLAPAAEHCPDPHPYQAFHFGLQQGLKLMAALAGGPAYQHLADYNLLNIENTWKHFQRDHDRRLGLASIGAELAIQQRFQPEHVSYSHPFGREVCTPFEFMGIIELKQEAERLRQASSACFPQRARLLRSYRYVRRWSGLLRHLLWTPAQRLWRPRAVAVAPSPEPPRQ